MFRSELGKMYMRGFRLEAEALRGHYCPALTLSVWWFWTSSFSLLQMVKSWKHRTECQHHRGVVFCPLLLSILSIRIQASFSEHRQPFCSDPPSLWQDMGEMMEKHFAPPPVLSTLLFLSLSFFFFLTGSLKVCCKVQGRGESKRESGWMGRREKMRACKFKNVFSAGNSA